MSKKSYDWVYTTTNLETKYFDGDKVTIAKDVAYEVKSKGNIDLKNVKWPN